MSTIESPRAAQPAAASHVIAADQLRALGRLLLEGAGCNPAEAAAVADALVEASIAGHDSHGVARFASYVGALKRGEVKANRTATLKLSTDALAIFDGDFGFGQIVGRQAVEHGIALAKRSGAAVVGLGRSGHLGRIGDFARLAAAEGQISLHFVNVPGGLRVAPFGGREPRFGTNPIGAGVPVAGGEPVILDISTAIVPAGKVQLAKTRGELLPEGLILDRDGHPTRDPADVFDGGSILPIAGHRGSGLSLVVELIAGAFTGGGTSRPEAPFLYNNMLSIFIDATRQGAFADEARHYADWVRASAAIDQAAPVKLPGERLRKFQEREATGLTVDGATWGQLRAAAISVGLDGAKVDGFLAG